MSATLVWCGIPAQPLLPVGSANQVSFLSLIYSLIVLTKAKNSMFVSHKYSFSKFTIHYVHLQVKMQISKSNYTAVN